MSNKLETGIQYMQEGNWEEAAKILQKQSKKIRKMRLDILTLRIY